MSSQIENTLPEIRDFFEREVRQVYKQSDLKTILVNNQGKGWKLPQNLTTPAFVKELVANTSLRKVVLQSMNDYPPITRYVWGKASPYEMALSLKPNSYLCHGTAVFLHGLNDQIPRTIYVNKEQSPKQMPTIALTQEGIDRAFANKQRTSIYEFLYKNHRIVLLSGKNSDRLEVSTIKGPNENWLEVTKVERTLIDIAVRPAYTGGVYQVLAAYKGAKDRVSITTIITILQKFAYSYPYHQAIGFYMERAGYSLRDLKQLKNFGLEFDFYLDYGITEKNRKYDNEWKLFYPKGL